ncbi:MAG: preprotein translocase subunit SecE [Clostridiales bacterium]|nr:preprotein translocase subunit SecE [Clostridiales bacterium]
MADKKKPNIFKRIGQKIKEIRLELKRVVWPSKEKLKTTSAVVLVVIAFFAVFLSTISLGGNWLLEKIGFYDPDETTTTTEAIEEEIPVATQPAETEAPETVEETEPVEESAE